MRITNTQVGPRGLNTKAGPLMLEPGESVDVEMSEAELKAAKDSGWFEFGKAAPAKQDENKPLMKG